MENQQLEKLKSIRERVIERINSSPASRVRADDVNFLLLHRIERLLTEILTELKNGRPTVCNRRNDQATMVAKNILILCKW